MSASPVDIEHGLDGRACVLVLNEPRTRNALSLEMRRALLDALHGAMASERVRAVIVTGAAGNFSSGGDIRAMRGVTAEAVRERMTLLHELARTVLTGPKPVLAAVEGSAAGGGLSLALLCDRIVAARDARLRTGFEKLGLVGDLGIAWTLPRRVGAARARDLLLFGCALEAPEAQRIGLVDDLVDPGASLQVALGLAGRLAELSPQAVAATRRLLPESAASLDEALRHEAQTQAAMVETEEFRERLARIAGKPPR